MTRCVFPACLIVAAAGWGRLAAADPKVGPAEVAAALAAHDRAVFVNPGWIRDPYIVLASDGYYYLTGTTPLPDDPREKSDPYNTGLGDASIVGWKVRAWRSRDLAGWESLGTPYSLKDGHWFANAAKDFEKTPERDWKLWAPEFHEADGRWVIVHTSPAPVKKANLSLTKDLNLSGPFTNPMGAKIDRRHDPSLFKDDDGTWWLVWGATQIAKLKKDFSDLDGQPVTIGPTGDTAKMGHEGCLIRKIGGKYVLFGTGWSTGLGRKGSYNLYYATADQITGPYSERKFAGRFLGHGTPFQDKQGRWWCTAFYNGNVPPLDRKGIETKDLGQTAQTINPQGVTLVPLDVTVGGDGGVTVRAKDPAYATPGPDEKQKFAPAKPGVSLFPAPPGLAASPHYRVEVETADGWRPSYVNFNPARKDGAEAGDQPGRSMSWTTFLADAPVRVRVTAAEGSATGVVVRPTRHGIAPVAVDRTAEFTLAPGQKVSVEFPHAVRENCFTGPPHGVPCVMHALMVFADRPSADPLAGVPASDIARLPPGSHAEPKPVTGLANVIAHSSTLGDAGGKRVVVFAPGVHDLGYWQVPNGVEHVHLEPGAVVFGALDVLPRGRQPGRIDFDKTYRDGWRGESLRESFRVTGHGVLCGSKLPWHLKKDFSYHPHDHWWQHVKLLQLAAASVEVRDVTLADAPYWTVSLLNDSDPRTRGRFENFKVVGAWTYNNDGLPVPGGAGSVVRGAFVHADDDAFKLYHSDARVEDCVVWQGNNGAVFQFGWFPKTVRGVRVRGVDVIHDENWYGVGLSNRAAINYADAGGKGVIEDVRFEDVRFEGRVLRLFGFKASGGQAIRDFAFKNVRVDGFGAGQLGPPGRNYFVGDVTAFRFDGFAVGGRPVTTAADGGFDFGAGAGGGFEIDGRAVEPGRPPQD